MHTDSDTRPLFRSYRGTSSPTRYFPALTAILSGNLDSITGGAFAYDGQGYEIQAHRAFR